MMANIKSIAFNNVAEQFDFELNRFRELLGIENPGPLEREIKGEIVKILETAPIQALSHRYQLGLVYRVLDKGKHTRLDHTIGVVAKCIISADRINFNSEESGLQFNKNDVKELAVAAALHDCGHLPVSHATERAFLTAKGIRKGITHEERILPLIVNRNPYFDELRSIVLSWPEFNENSFYRIASIISPINGDEYEKKIRNYIRPKRAIQQLLVSDIDMDRLDYIIRDASELNYLPVKTISTKLVNYIKDLTLIKYKSLSQENFEENVELCLSEDNKESVFNLLVSRVLLYKYIYFSEKIRCFEATLTYLIGTFIDNNIALEPLRLIAMSDDYFINTYLDKLVLYVDNENGLQDYLKEQYIDVLKNDKVERFKYLLPIHDEDIVNPRLKGEFTKEINKRSYIDNLRSYINTAVNKDKLILEQGDILIDVFNLKTGGGDLLVREKDGSLQTLNHFMNGSNMHRLCSEIRLDIYIKSDLGDKVKESVSNEINLFFKNI